MRYDNIFWVLIAPALASCACFAFEMSGNFAESWNTLKCSAAKRNPRTFNYLFSRCRRQTMPNGSF
jgi:hypothetical protein